MRGAIEPQAIGAHPGAIVLGTTCKRVVKTGAFEHARVAEHELVDGGATESMPATVVALVMSHPARLSETSAVSPANTLEKSVTELVFQYATASLFFRFVQPANMFARRGRRRSVPLIDTRNRGERPVILEHARKVGRARHVHIRTIEARKARMVGKPIGGVLQNGRAVGIDGQHVCQAGDVLPGKLIGSLGNGLV